MAPSPGVLADLASGATIAAAALLYRAGILQFWHLVLLVFVLASLNSNGDTARLAELVRGCGSSAPARCCR